MLVVPIARIEAIELCQANSLLTEWGHKMGPIRRPKFSFETHHALFEDNVPVAVICAGETVRQVVGQTGIRREDCVELTRLCAAREHLCRPFLRLWREICFPRIARAHNRTLAVSYQDESLHSGNVYRFDGWLDIGKGGGGGSDRRGGAKGRKLRIWAWPPQQARLLLEVGV